MYEATQAPSVSDRTIATPKPALPPRPPSGFLAEFWLYLRVRKKFWLLPIILVMLLFGGLIVLTKGTALAPFVYTLF